MRYAHLVVMLAAVGAASPSVGRADVVVDWNLVTLEVAGAQPARAHFFAMVHAAMHDAVNAVEGRYEPYAVAAQAAEGTSAEAAAVGAAYGVLIRIFPTQAAVLDARRALSLAAIPDGRGETDGLALGDSIAARIVDLRANDGAKAFAEQSCGTIPPPLPGVYTPPEDRPSTFLVNSCIDVRPLVLNSTSQFRAEGPPSLTSAEYAADLNEVKAFGSKISEVRSPDQTHAALFWLEGTTLSWNRVARLMVAKHRPDLVTSARLFALMHLAHADAGVACADTKYAFWFWRPISGIRRADEDGNPDTDPDRSWVPLNLTPIHPDYTSSAACNGGAASTVIRSVLGRKADTGFCMTTTSTAVPAGSTRCFRSVKAAADDAGDSRVWVGYHFRTAVRHGLNLGKHVGNWAVKHFLKPLDDDDDDHDGDDDDDDDHDGDEEDD